MSRRPLMSLIVIVLLAVAAQAQQVPGADGSDGVLNVTSDQTIDLGLAAPAQWDSPSPAQHGVYDAAKWAVVLKYSSVTVASGRTLTFLNHPSRAPLMLLVNGNVAINGTLNVAGGATTNTFAPAEPGPGGFRGGVACGTVGGSVPGSAGFGPGGGSTPGPGICGGPGAAGMRSYGLNSGIPLIGGSGGSHWDNGSSWGGGAGGGAILIAATGTVTINGLLTANGGVATGSFVHDRGGSGGEVRLVCAAVVGSGSIQAIGNTGGGAGLIRGESNNWAITGVVTPSPSLVAAPAVANYWAVPTAAITSVDSNPVPAEPLARINFPNFDVRAPRFAGNTVVIETRGLNAVAGAVRLRAVSLSGADQLIDAALVSGNSTLATWQVQLNLGSGLSILQVFGRVMTPAPQQYNTFSREVSVFRNPCGADFNNDGDSATDADIEAFFACIAGNCCASCDSADFNSDGDTATDADIEAFFRVLAGGPC